MLRKERLRRKLNYDTASLFYYYPDNLWWIIHGLHAAVTIIRDYNLTKK